MHPGVAILAVSVVLRERALDSKPGGDEMLHEKAVRGFDVGLVEPDPPRAKSPSRVDESAAASEVETVDGGPLESAKLEGPGPAADLFRPHPAPLDESHRFPSLELATEPDLYVGGHSFRAPNQVLPMEYNPRKLFDRLFGPGDSLRERAAILESTGSVLDRIQEEAARFKQSLGPADRGRMEDYLSWVRDAERQTKT